MSDQPEAVQDPKESQKLSEEDFPELPEELLEEFPEGLPEELPEELPECLVPLVPAEAQSKLAEYLRNLGGVGCPKAQASGVTSSLWSINREWGYTLGGGNCPL